MIPKHLSSVLLSSLLVAAASAAVGQTCPAPPAGDFPPAPAGFTHTAVADGTWNSTVTWGGSVPGTGAIVCIPAGRHVNVTSQEASRLRFIQVNGELRMWIQSSTRLYIDTLFVASGGLFVIGDPVNTVKPGVLAELVFISWDGNAINHTWDASEKSRGLIALGSVKVYGEPKSHMVAMTADALKAATSLTVDSAPFNWKAGDTIVLTGSYFRRVGGVEPVTSSQDERVTITSVTGSSINFTPGLLYDHVRARSDLRLHVANLTRNIVFRSESTSIPLRGHIMLLNGDVDIRHVSLVNLGRTNKTVPLDDMVVALTTNSLGQPDYSITPNTGTINNRRGRYALHFHHNGTLPGSSRNPSTVDCSSSLVASSSPSKVYNSVVDGTAGWGFVSHDSYVDFQCNVAYNFVGAGFVTEAGDELGNFENNIAIRGTGDGVYDTNRIVFGNPLRPQPLSDFAFRGDGFWFQGPAVRAKNNVAAGCDGAGMIWFTTGSPNVDDRFTENGVTHDRYTSFPRNAVATVYGAFPDLSLTQRYWDHSVTNEKVVIVDLPILECDGFESYGNLVGFRLRFNNHNSLGWYTEDPFNFDNHIKGSVVRMRQKVMNLKLWNNELAFRTNYTTHTDWSNVLAINRLDYDAQNPYAGAVFDFTVADLTFTTLTIDGYEVAGQIESCDSSSRATINFSGQSYLNYANFDTWNVMGSCSPTPPPACPVPAGVAVTFVSSTSRTISWGSNAAQKRYLVRYRANGDQQWKLVDTAGTSVTLTGLSTGRTYTYQVVAGCKDTGTGKETAPSTYTLAATFPT